MHPAEIREVITKQALTSDCAMQAFASSWADAVSCDNCYVDVDAATESIGSVLVTAATSAYCHVCAGAFSAHELAMMHVSKKFPEQDPILFQCSALSRTYTDVNR